MQTLLLTGASGFIGRHLLKALKQEPFCQLYDIVALSSQSIVGCNTVLHNNYQFSENYFQQQGIEAIDVVIHAGAFTPKNKNEFDSFENNSNITGTLNLLNALPSKPSKFIYLSTLDVYETTNDILNESSSVQPQTLYGWSKLYSEKCLTAWAIQNNICLQLLRIGHIYGVGEAKYQKLIPVTIQKVLKKESPEIINQGEEKRSFLHISDCVAAIVNSLSLAKTEGVINIVSSISYTVSEIVHMIIELSEKEVLPVYIHKDIATRNLLFDSKRMQKLLHRETVPIRVGLQEEINSYS